MREMSFSINQLDELIQRLPSVARPRHQLKLYQRLPALERAIAVDALRYEVYQDLRGQHLWIRLSGGIVDMERWFGPITRE
jgi:hypothetical protein